MKKLFLGLGILAMSACGVPDGSISLNQGENNAAPAPGFNKFNDTLTLKQGVSYKIAGKVTGLRKEKKGETGATWVKPGSVTLTFGGASTTQAALEITENGEYETGWFTLTSDDVNVQLTSSDPAVNCYAVKQYNPDDETVKNNAIPVDIQCVCASKHDEDDPAAVDTKSIALGALKPVAFNDTNLLVPSSYTTSQGKAYSYGLDGSTNVELTSGTRSFSEDFFGIVSNICNCVHDIDTTSKDAAYKILAHGSAGFLGGKMAPHRIGLYNRDAKGDYKEVVKAKYDYQKTVEVYQILNTARKKGEEASYAAQPEPQAELSKNRTLFGDHSLVVPEGTSIDIEESPYKFAFPEAYLTYRCSNAAPLEGKAGYAMGTNEVFRAGKKVMVARIYRLVDGAMVNGTQYKKYEEIIRATFDKGQEAQVNSIFNTIEKN